MSNNTHITVITGDLVGSTELGPTKIERAMQALADCAEEQGRWYGSPLNFTRHRGDGWQVALRAPGQTLRAFLAFRAALRREGSEFDSYFGIATGPGPVDLPENLNRETSETFAASGLALDRRKEQDEPLSIGPHGNVRQKAGLILADYISSDWTQSQAATIFPMLAPTASETSYTDLARLLGKSRQSVTKSLYAAGYRHIRQALHAAEQEDAQT